MKVYHVQARATAWDAAGNPTEYTLDSQHTLREYDDMRDLFDEAHGEWEEADLNFVGQRPELNYVACWQNDENDPNTLTMVAVEDAVESYETR